MADSPISQISQLPISPVSSLFGQSALINTIAFDTHQELLWIGDNHGHVVSYHGHQLERHTSIQAHPELGGPVNQFLFNSAGVISLALSSIHLMNRGCLTQWHCEHASMARLKCMTFFGKGLILAAGGRTLFKIDSDRGDVLERLPANADYTLMRSHRYVCAATNSGCVDFLDTTTLQVVKTWQAHTSRINDMDARHDFLVTCGWTVRPHGPPSLENLAKVYDLRRLEHLSPISFPTGAAYVQIHPKMSTTGVIGSTGGQLQVVDLMNPNTTNMQMLSYYINNFVMSPSGNVWAMVDRDNTVHLWGLPDKLQFNDISKPTETMDVVESVQHIAFNEQVSFGTVGMPYYRERLLSAWGNDMPFEAYQPAPKIDPIVERSMQPSRIGHVAQNHSSLERNQAAPVTLTNLNNNGGSSRNQLDIESKESGTNPMGGDHMSAEILADLTFSGATKEGVPWYYMNVKIKYGRYGISDFNFRAYNDTCYSGLETDIANSYLNPLLQLYKYTPFFRNVSLSHVAGPCVIEDCLLCEMGFLFDMVEKAQGEICQATNFLKAYSNIPDAASVNETEGTTQIKSLETQISKANRFLLKQTSIDARRASSPSSSLDAAILLTARTLMKCTRDGYENLQQENSFLIDLVYSDLVNPRRTRMPHPKFSEVLKWSFAAVSNGRGYCPGCRSYSQQRHRRAVIDLPPVLILDAAIKHWGPAVKQFWATPSWLPVEIGLSIDNQGNVTCFEGDRLKSSPRNGNIAVYELVGLVADVESTKGQNSHLVSLINVSISERVSQWQNRWHLFNDFLVKAVGNDEALNFPPWKTPVVLTYQLQKGRHNLDDSWQANLNTYCLYYEGSLNYVQSENDDNGLALREAVERPDRNFFFGIDAEFVTLIQEEVEINFHGDRQIIRPARKSIGRISAVRGMVEQEGLPFIDDYISVREPIVDYATGYSGISEGDLDVNVSSYHLLPLKVAYKKIWLLLNLGCTFIGHGLVNDFRQINIYVPPNQVIDTVLLYHLPDKRYCSLKFLAWYILGQQVQVSNHDSNEDARTALRLWRKYQEFEDAGVVDQKLAEIYRDGPATGWLPGPLWEKAKAKRKTRYRGRSDRDTDADLLGGRLTPEPGGSRPGSIPVTPETRKRALEGGYFGSPLK